MARIEIAGSFADVDPRGWDALVGDDSPFLEHAFLYGLEATGCAVPGTGWAARPTVIRDDDGRVVAGAPAWRKTHSMGEFVYDHAWAHAAQRAGIPYYPKVVVAVPFTPVTGHRLLVREGEDAAARRRQLLAALSEAARDAHGLHLLFDTAEEAALAESLGLFTREQFQFHWTNEGYADFEDWLCRAFSSKKRNKIRRERREVRDALHIEVITEPPDAILDALYDLYALHCRRFGPWGRIYLTRRFFHHLGRAWRHRLHAVIARDGDRVVAGAFNVFKGDRLYGRYWGAVEDVRFLHFEVCYYAPIAWCIAHGMRAFEPGHGGGHKYRRGFLPVITRSNHRLADPRLHAALRDHARLEREHVRAEAAFLAGRAR